MKPRFVNFFPRLGQGGKKKEKTVFRVYHTGEDERACEFDANSPEFYDDVLYAVGILAKKDPAMKRKLLRMTQSLYTKPSKEARA